MNTLPASGTDAAAHCTTIQRFPLGSAVTTQLMPIVMDATGVSRSLTRIAHEIAERNRDSESIALVGIRTRGVPLAKRIAGELRAISGWDVPAGVLDITPYRDDRTRVTESPEPSLYRTDIPFPLDGRHIVLVDDVLCTGRTIRAALEALTGFGRPAKVQLVVLVDRGHRELPIRADYVGRNIPTSRQQRVLVRLAEVDGEDGVALTNEAEPSSRRAVVGP